jgi:hypothetical protein
MAKCMLLKTHNRTTQKTKKMNDGSINNIPCVYHKWWKLWCIKMQKGHVVLSSVLSCYVSLRTEFCVVLLCVFTYWVLCCPVMCLYVLSSVLFCYVSLRIEFCVVLLCVFTYRTQYVKTHNRTTQNSVRKDT